ncbi:MAG TPA: ABC transporter ATP-binding protein [Euryarchaeota archaeon]|nr:MAG: ABC transporter ATP-binding protein [Aciduliprofundum sp.]HEU13135.1 ABC transporter ATP-binding protein [Euryarchaeota archaeon]
MIQVIGLSKTFDGRRPVRALKNVNFEIGKGEVLGFVGLNGAGKTTTIRIMAGVIRPDSGQVLIDGKDAIANHDSVAEMIAWVPENPIFDPTMKGRDFLIYISRFNNRNISRDKIDEALARVGLAEKANEKIKGYSLGMKRRLALAQAFIFEPEIMLMDEAMNGLDPEGMNFFRETMKEFKKSGGSVLLSSHILTEISGISDRITFIHRGETFQTSTVEELEDEFRKKLGNYTYFEVDSLDDNELEEIRRNFGVNAKFDGKLLWIKDASDDEIGNINIYLVKKNHRVMQIKRAEFNLETLFLQKVRELEGVKR